MIEQYNKLGLEWQEDIVRKARIELDKRHPDLNQRQKNGTYLQSDPIDPGPVEAGGVVEVMAIISFLTSIISFIITIIQVVISIISFRNQRRKNALTNFFKFLTYITDV